MRDNCICPPSQEMNVCTCLRPGPETVYMTFTVAENTHVAFPPGILPAGTYKIVKT